MEFGLALRKITSILDRLSPDIQSQVMRSLIAGYRPQPLSEAARSSRYRDGKRHAAVTLKRDGKRHVDRHSAVTAHVTKVSPTPPSKASASTDLKNLEVPTTTAESQEQDLPRANDFFSKFWSLYPKKKAKEAALKAWRKLSQSNGLFDVIFDDVVKRRNSHEWQKDGGEFIPYPATYLNGRRWEDELPTIEIGGSFNV